MVPNHGRLSTCDFLTDNRGKPPSDDSHIEHRMRRITLYQVNFMTNEWSDGRHPMKTVDLAEWTTSRVTPITISNCFAKSTLLECELIQELSPVAKLKDLLSQVQRLTDIGIREPTRGRFGGRPYNRTPGSRCSCAGAHGARNRKAQPRRDRWPAGAWATTAFS